MAKLPEQPVADPLGPASFCVHCGVGLVHDARFCHRCGTPVAAAPAAGDRRTSSALGGPRASGASAPTASTTPAARHVAPASMTPDASPPVLRWGVAFIGLMAVVATFAGRSYASSRASAATGPTFAADAPGALPGEAGALGNTESGGTARATDISAMTPDERADRLYERVMIYDAQNARDSLLLFAPMALSAHEMIPELTLERRYHAGQIAEAAGLPDMARAQADTILQVNPQHLLGLILAARASRLAGDAASVARFDDALRRVAEGELARGLPEYDQHRAEIEEELALARRPARP